MGDGKSDFDGVNIGDGAVGDSDDVMIIAMTMAMRTVKLIVIATVKVKVIVMAKQIIPGRTGSLA